MSNQSSSSSNDSPTESLRSAVSQASIDYDRLESDEENNQSNSLLEAAAEDESASSDSSVHSVLSQVEAVYSNVSSPVSVVSEPIAHSTPFGGAGPSHGHHLRSSLGDLQYSQGVQPPTRQRRVIPVPLCLRTYGLTQQANLNDHTFNIPTGDDTLENVTPPEFPSSSSEEATYVNSNQVTVNSVLLQSISANLPPLELSSSYSEDEANMA